MYYLYNMDIPIYKNKLPIINENVLVIFTEYKDTHIEAEFIEYNLKGMMIYEDATRKKKVYDWHKIIPLNKLTVAKVEEIFSDEYIKISTAYFDHKKDPIELSKELMLQFNENKVLINIIKKLCKNTNLEFNNFWEKIIYEIDEKRREDNLNESLFKYIKENTELFNKYINEIFTNDNIIDNFNKLINNKIYKIKSNFSLTTIKTIQNITNLLSLACENNKDWNYVIKYESTPLFLLESSNENSSQEQHNNFLKFVQDNSSTFDVEYF